MTTGENRAAGRMASGNQSAGLLSTALAFASGVPVVNQSPYILTPSFSSATQTPSAAFRKASEVSGSDPLFDAKLAALSAQTDAKFAAVNGRVDVLDAKFDAFLKRFDIFAASMATVPTDLAALKAQMPFLATKQEMADTVNKVGARMRNQLYGVALAITIGTAALKYLG